MHSGRFARSQGRTRDQARRVAEAPEDLLRRGYREIRRLADDGQAPWAGTLVCAPDGQTGILLDAAALGAQWRGWSAAAAGHVLGPLDVLRRPDGHDVLLPVCTERLSDFLARRGGPHSDLSAGEAVTVAVSLLRGLAELDADEPERGCWWLTDSGRPVFATGASDDDLHTQTGDLLQRLADDAPALSGALAPVIAVMADAPRRSRAGQHAERELFAVAEPLALATTTFGPRRARTDAVPPRDEASTNPIRRGWMLNLVQHVDADWADVVSRTTTGIWRRATTARASSRRPWLLAAGVAVAVLIAGLVWPTGSEDPATAEPEPLPSVSADPSATSAAQGAVDDDTPAPDAATDATGSAVGDLATIAGELLTARTACDGDSACLAAIQESAGAAFPAGATDLTADARTVTLLDEFGGAAVLRVDAREAGSASQLVVLVRVEETWLLRDVYDVAQQ